MLWGTPGRLHELLGGNIRWISLSRRTFDFCYHSPDHVSEWLRLYYGPITRLAGTLEDATRATLAADLADVPTPFNQADDGTVCAPAEYLQAIGIRP